MTAERAVRKGLKMRILDDVKAKTLVKPDTGVGWFYGKRCSVWGTQALQRNFKALLSQSKYSGGQPWKTPSCSIKLAQHKAVYHLEENLVDAVRLSEVEVTQDSVEC
ncbi:hypothetical protein cyc_00430 [Cyclospora cayetanensis]|uniref:Uncharacterized protein n=1 Tax=Cyclospora cayetanensis TaxID=88456 RepID=A0A1D3CRH5_9EIME|nr:hypothetical protein cyc_00430 [Cyclospora cayetanensis]